MTQIAQARPVIKPFSDRIHFLRLTNPISALVESSYCWCCLGYWELADGGPTHITTRLAPSSRLTRALTLKPPRPNPWALRRPQIILCRIKSCRIGRRIKNQRPNLLLLHLRKQHLRSRQPFRQHNLERRNPRLRIPHRLPARKALTRMRRKLRQPLPNRLNLPVLRAPRMLCTRDGTTKGKRGTQRRLFPRPRLSRTIRELWNSKKARLIFMAAVCRRIAIRQSEI